MTWSSNVRARRIAALLGLAALAGSGAFLVRAARVEPRALAAAGEACDADAARAAKGIGSLLAFRDAEGALEAVREAVGNRRLLSTVVLDAAGHVKASHAIPLPGLAHVSRAEVFFEGNRVGSIVLGFSLEEAREESDRSRRRALAGAALLALAGLPALAAAAVGLFRSKLRRVSAEHARVSVERAGLAARSAEMEARLEIERRDRRFAESALSARDLFEIERSEILEMIARGEELPSILSSLAALVEHRRPERALHRGAAPAGRASRRIRRRGRAPVRRAQRARPDLLVGAAARARRRDAEPAS